jgi:hypothetical protein
VLCVCALGDSVADAQRSAYDAVAGISWHGEFHRHDIGWRAIARERKPPEAIAQRSPARTRTAPPANGGGAQRKLPPARGVKPLFTSLTQDFASVCLLGKRHGFKRRW